MLFSQISQVLNLHVQRDFDFHSVGLLTHDKKNMLACYYDKAYLHLILKNKNIVGVITSTELLNDIPDAIGVALTNDPLKGLYDIHCYLLNETNFYWDDFITEISPTANIHPDAYIAPNNVRIGAKTRIEPNATVLEKTIIGEGVTIRAGAVIAGEGFEPKFIGKKHIIFPHAGGVLINDNVEIQSNSHIQRSVFGAFTEIGEGTKIDAFVHIGHHCQVGKNCEIAAGAILAGSTIIGNNVWIGPNATISNDLSIGDNVFITMGSVVTTDVSESKKVTGNFAIEHSKFLRFIKSIRK